MIKILSKSKVDKETILDVIKFVKEFLAIIGKGIVGYFWLDVMFTYAISPKWQFSKGMGMRTMELNFAIFTRSPLSKIPLTTPPVCAIVYHIGNEVLPWAT